MEPQEKLTTQQFIIDRLHDIQRKAESNKFADALSAVKEVKAADAKNLYLIAIEKQIAKLSDGSLAPESRADIIRSLPAMVDRAISDLQRRPAAPKVDETQKEQKEAALEKLKSQYFQRADDYVEKKEYQRALEEIRRIYIIEPGSIVAKEYEQKIEQLASLQTKAEAETPQAVETEENAQPESTGSAENLVLEEEPQKTKMPLIAGAAAALVILVVAIWFIFLRGPKETQPSQPAATEQPSQPAAATTPESTPAVTSPATTPEPEKTTPAPVSETSKPSAKPTKAKPEVKPATSTKTPTAKPQPEKKQPAPEVTAAPPPAAEPVKPAETAPVAVPFVAIQETPKVIHREPPVYPSVALRMGIEGRVVVEVTVDAQGRPIQANVVESTSDIFDESATEAALKTTYKPAVMTTGPVTAKVRVTFDFQLRR
jgi:periplasmic protein TonB